MSPKINLMFPDFNEIIKQMFRDDLKQQAHNKKVQNKEMTCTKCHFLNEYPEANQDADTYICYKCRKGL
jgi:hypothetical protein